MPNFKYDSVVFVDLDGTIIRGPFEPAVFPVVFGELARKTGRDVQEIRHRVLQAYLARQKDAALAVVQAVDWDDIFKAIAAGWGVELEADAVAIANAHAGPPDAAILDHADQVLKELASPHRAIVVATKGLGKYQLPVLNALGLTPLFTDILTPDVNGALKNDIAFYGHWPRFTRLQISVGDHYQDDVVAPKRFGFNVIWKVGTPDQEAAEQLAGKSHGKLYKLDPFVRPTSFNYAQGQTVRPDAIIFSLRELPDVVDRIESQ
jgi:putative hydrolase of the HAD superfamily